MISLQNPYGDGKASQRIAKILEKASYMICSVLGLVILDSQLLQ